MNKLSDIPARLCRWLWLHTYRREIYLLLRAGKILCAQERWSYRRI